MPPPMHRVARPFLALRRPISCSRVTSTRAPEAPIGWPMAMAPPFYSGRTYANSVSVSEDRCFLLRSCRPFDANSITLRRIIAAAAVTNGRAPGLRWVASQTWRRDKERTDTRSCVQAASRSNCSASEGCGLQAYFACCLRIMCTISMPLRIARALSMDLNPSIGRTHRLMAR